MKAGETGCKDHQFPSEDNGQIQGFFALLRGAQNDVLWVRGFLFFPITPAPLALSERTATAVGRGGALRGMQNQQIPYGNDRKKSKGKCCTQAKTGLEWATCGQLLVSRV